GVEVVRVELAQPLPATPEGFAIQTPPRIAIDLPGVGNATGRSSHDVNAGNLRSINIAQSGERTRLVLNLKAPSTYNAHIEGNALILVMDNTGSAAAVAAAATTHPVATTAAA